MAVKTRDIFIAGGLTIAAIIAYRKLSGRMISNRGLKFLIDSEGSKSKMYKDVKGLPTIGVGHLITSKEPQLLTATLTQGQIKRLLDKDLDRFEKVVKDTIRVPLKQYQKDALIHFAFNIGESGFKNSTLAKLVNSKSPAQDIIAAFSQWRTPSSLSTRRAKEARLFLTGNYSSTLSSSDFNKYFNPGSLSDCFPETNCKIVRLEGKYYRLAS